MITTIHKNLNSYERRNLYLKCESEGSKFEKKTIMEKKWVCRKHKKILTPSDDAWCSDICCLNCPKAKTTGADDWECNFKQVLTKLKVVVVYDYKFR